MLSPGMMSWTGHPRRYDALIRERPCLTERRASRAPCGFCGGFSTTDRRYVSSVAAKASCASSVSVKRSHQLGLSVSRLWKTGKAKASSTDPSVARNTDSSAPSEDQSPHKTKKTHNKNKKTKKNKHKNQPTKASSKR